MRGKAGANCLGASIQGMCMAQCAIYIDVVDEKLVRTRPNTNDKRFRRMRQGHIRHFNAWLDPGAIKRPMARAPPVERAQGKITWREAERRLAQSRGGYGGFVEIYWQTAIEIIARKLKELADDNKRHAFTFPSGAWAPCHL